jgi:malate dehydrogenase (oxaloacetate-decarboxylating)
MRRHFTVSKKDGAVSYRVTGRGREVLDLPLLNKGTAFPPEEREALGLNGLLPPVHEPLERQVKRAYGMYREKTGDLEKNIFLATLHDSNEVLFYALMAEHLHEMMPIVYDPTVGIAIEQYSHEFRRARGVYLSIEAPDGIEEAFSSFGAGPDEIDLIVATDSEEILGIGDWGVGGINISVGKLAVYTAAAGIDPARTIAVVMDVGTNRESLLNDPLYVGYRHSRVRSERYDAFIDAYVKTATRMFPNALLHWEDFGPNNGRRILERYRDSVCTFNDDMQGTGAITLAAVISAVKVSGVPMRDHRVIVFGAGTAGIGIADQVRDAMVADGRDKDEATRQVWCVDVQGLLTADMGHALRPYQVSYARPSSEVSDWPRTGPDGIISLADTVSKVHPTILIGTSTAPHTFTEAIVQDMARHCDRPIILPLSNPTRLAEADPADLILWTDGKALIATGSPFPEVTHQGVTYVIGQANNALLYPGLGLGAIVSRASRISDGMLSAAARAVASCADVSAPGASLLPSVSDLRATSATVAVEVAKTAASEGLARAALPDVVQQVQEAMWKPEYVAFEAV